MTLFDGLPPAAPVTTRFGRVRWTIRSSELVSNIQRVLNEPDACLTDKSLLLRDNFRVTLGRVPHALVNGVHLLLRRTNYQGQPRKAFRDFFLTARPMLAFQNGLAFEKAGVATPRVMAAGVFRKWRKPVSGYLLVGEVACAETLKQHFDKHGQIQLSSIRRMAEMIAKMHEQGFLHGDLTINNVLLDEHQKPWFIDLDRARKLRHPADWDDAVEDFFRFSRHIKNHGPLAVRAGLRLIKHYCNLRGWNGREREFANTILIRLRKKIGYS